MNQIVQQVSAYAERTDEQDKLLEFNYKAPGTIRRQNTQWRLWEVWATEQGIDPLPVKNTDFARYLTEQAKTYTPATLNVRFFGVCGALRDQGLPSPADEKRMLLFLHKCQGEAVKRGSEPVKGLRASDMPFIRAAGRKIGKWREVAFIALARDALMRPAEISELRWKNLETSDDGSGLVTIARSKTDRAGKGAVMWVSPATMEDCALWKEHAPVISARERRRIDDRMFVISPSAISHAVETLCKQAGLKGNYSGKSCRIGMAEDLTEAGFSMTELMIAGRWKSPAMPMHYARNIAPPRGPVARFTERCEKESQPC